MTDNAKGTNHPKPVFTWAPRDERASVYRAEAAGLIFICDVPRKGGPWVVRGWDPTGLFFYREAKTPDAAKQLAQEKLDRYLADQRRAEEVTAALTVMATPRPLAYRGVDEGAELLAQVAATDGGWGSDPRRCLNCGGEGGGGSMDPDVWITCASCGGSGLGPSVQTASAGPELLARVDDDGIRLAHPRPGKRCPHCGGFLDDGYVHGLDLGFGGCCRYSARVSEM